MKKNLYSLKVWAQKKLINYVIFWSIFLLFSKALIIFFLNKFFNFSQAYPDQIKYFSDINAIYLFFLSCFFAPLYETFVYQFLVISMFNSITSKKFIKYFSILISAIIFAIAHEYDSIYFFTALYAGLIFGFLYSFSPGKRFKVHPFIIVASVHTVHNLVIFGLTQTALAIK